VKLKSDESCISDPEIPKSQIGLLELRGYAGPI